MIGRRVKGREGGKVNSSGERREGKREEQAAAVRMNLSKLLTVEGG